MKRTFYITNIVNNNRNNLEIQTDSIFIIDKIDFADKKYNIKS